MFRHVTTNLGLAAIAAFFSLAVIAISFGTIKFNDSQVYVIPSSRIKKVKITVPEAYAAGQNWYISTVGSAGGDGSLASPWDLQTGLADNTNNANPNHVIQPGDTVWIEAGTYSFPDTIINVGLKGVSGNQIIVRNYQNGRATLNIQQLNGSGNSANYVTFWGLEIENTHRSSVPADPWNTTSSMGPGTKFVNCIIHDTNIGMAGNNGGPVEATGNIMYYNGRPGDNLEHGIYWQNDFAFNGYDKLVKDNIIAYASSYGIHSYGSAGKLEHLIYDGNVLINNPMILGGSNPVATSTIENMMLYSSRDSSNTSQIQLGYSGSRNDSVTIQNNYLAAGPSPLTFRKPFTSATITGNTIVATNRFVISIDGANLTDIFGSGPFNVDNNSYYFPPPGYQPFYYHFGGGDFSLHQWNRDSSTTQVGGFDAHSATSTASPPDHVFVRPNDYESGRANIVIYNWSNASNQSVNVTGILNSGDHYELHNAENYYGDIITGQYNGGGTISIPMTGHTVAAPLDGSASGESTFPTFGAFVLISTGAVLSDTTPAVVSAGSPFGAQAAGTTQVTLAVTTDDPATCKYGTTVNTAYESLPNTFTTTDGTSHETTVSGLSNGGSYTFNIRCVDASGNTNLSDYTVSFNVSNPAPLGGGGGGSSSGGTGSYYITPVASNTDTAMNLIAGGVVATSSCKTYMYPIITQNLTEGNISTNVATLKRLLVAETFLTTTTPISNYDANTTRAVMALQVKYKIVSFGTAATTGFGNVGPKTRAIINALISQKKYPSLAQCLDNKPLPNTNIRFSRTLMVGSKGSDVKALQVFLNTHGFQVALSGNGSSGHETAYFGPTTAAAVTKFQNYYAKEVLLPYGLTKGTGYFGPASIMKANSI